VTPTAWAAALAAAGAAALALPARPRLALPVVAGPVEVGGAGWMMRFRGWWSLLAGVAAATFVTGTAGLVGGVAVAVVAWVAIGRAEPPRARRERSEVALDLPHLVGLLGSALEAGQTPASALAIVCDALPGAAARRLEGLPGRLALGLDPAEVWGALARDPELAVLGRTLARAHVSGAPVAVAIARLGHELEQAARADVEDQARQVGVRAAVPLGLCLLPAFVLLGIVPLVAGLASTLDLG